MKGRAMKVFKNKNKLNDGDKFLLFFFGGGPALCAAAIKVLERQRLCLAEGGGVNLQTDRHYNL